MTTENKVQPPASLFTGWRGAVVFSILGASFSVLGYSLYHSHWKMLEGYGEDNESLAVINSKNPLSLSGGDLTHFKFGNISFEQEAYNLHWKLSALFDNGDGVFERPFTAAVESGYRYDADGLGPLYNATACEGCHIGDGRAAPPLIPGQALEGLLFRISVPGLSEHGGPNPHPVYGGQLADKAIEGHNPEVTPVITYEEVIDSYPDGTVYSLRHPHYDFTQAYYGELGSNAMISPRIAPAMIGLGLLDAIDIKDMITLADPDDADSNGISGKVNWVWNEATGSMDIGKFGWKSEIPTLIQQIADAASNDMGITNPLFPKQTCTMEQTICQMALHGITNDEVELTQSQLDELVTYLEFLAVPARDPIDHPRALRGEQIFAEANCQGCHIDTLTTGNDQRRWRLRDQLIHPYTDLLLHDMGEGLADNRPSFDANGQEWRTAPLWGIGMTEKVNNHTFFMHDGRARNLEEAILWHGGEAESAKQYFMSRSQPEREDLLAFLRSL